MVEVLTTDVAQLDVLQVLPDSLVRVEVGRVGRPSLQMGPLGPAVGLELLHLPAVDGRAVPDDEQVPADTAAHVPEEADAIAARQRPSAHQRVELPGRRDAAHHREVAITQQHLEHGRLPCDVYVLTSPGRR